jgi:hypothetical protein
MRGQGVPRLCCRGSYDSFKTPQTSRSVGKIDYKTSGFAAGTKRNGQVALPGVYGAGVGWGSDWVVRCSLPTVTVKTKEYFCPLKMSPPPPHTVRWNALAWGGSHIAAPNLQTVNPSWNTETYLRKCPWHSVTRVLVDINNLHTCLFRGYDVCNCNDICRLVWAWIKVS